MKARWIAALLMTLALVASSFAVAYAGGMGAPVPISLFDCYVIHNGADSPYVLEVTDQFGTRQHVNLGNARLLCTPTTGAVVERGPALNGNFDPNAENVDHLKCYDVVPSVAGPTAVVTINDPFVAETVSLLRLSVLCAPATKEVIP